MNTIYLTGTVRNIRDSHQTGTVYYRTCDLVSDDQVIQLVFKQGEEGKIKEDQLISTTGTVRTYSKDRHTQLYVYTYLDNVESEFRNKVQLDGEIVKKDTLYTYPNKKCNLHFIVKNVVSTKNGDIINFIPCVARNDLARRIDAGEFNLIKLEGELHSRVYQKQVDGESQFNITYEIEVTNIESLV